MLIQTYFSTRITLQILNAQQYYNSIFPWLERCEKVLDLVGGIWIKENLWIFGREIYVLLV